MEIDSQQATDYLKQLLDTQTELATQQAEANRLKSEELAINRIEAENRSRELDIQEQGLAIERERLNRAEARLQEVIQRYSIASEKLITTDDAFGETVQRNMSASREIVGALVDVEKAIYALLTKNVDDLQQGKATMPGSLRKLRTQELLLKHQETLHNLQLQAAGHGGLDVPVRLLNEIEQTLEKIETLEQQLADN